MNSVQILPPGPVCNFLSYDKRTLVAGPSPWLTGGKKGNSKFEKKDRLLFSLSRFPLLQLSVQVKTDVVQFREKSFAEV